MKDYYKILGLKATASPEDIHARWIELMRKFHPDKGRNGAEQDQRVREINEAYGVLKHPSVRAHYDLERNYHRKKRNMYLQRMIIPPAILLILLILSVLYFKRSRQTSQLDLTNQISQIAVARLRIKVLNDQNNPNALNVPNAPNVTNDLNAPNALSEANAPNDINDPNALNVTNDLNEPNVRNAPNAPNDPNTPTQPNQTNQINRINEINQTNETNQINRKAVALSNKPKAAKIPKVLTRSNAPNVLNALNDPNDINDPNAPNALNQKTQIRVASAPNSPKVLSRSNDPNAPNQINQTTQKPVRTRTQPKVTKASNAPNQKNQINRINEINQTNQIDDPNVPNARNDQNQNVAALSKRPKVTKPPKALGRSNAPNDINEPNALNVTNDLNEPNAPNHLNEISQLTPPPLIATEAEVKHFFALYRGRYNRKDIDALLSLFSPRSVQNQRDGFDEIKKIYSDFFDQSEKLSYRIKDMRIEIFQNAVEVWGRYEIDQRVKEGGEKKVWRGDIRWVLVKEDGALKIRFLDYKPQESP